MSELIRRLLSLVMAIAYNPEQTGKVYRHHAKFFWAGVRGEWTEGHPSYRAPGVSYKSLIYELLNILSAVCFLFTTCALIIDCNAVLACCLTVDDTFANPIITSSLRISRLTFQSANCVPSSAVMAFQNKFIMIVIDGAKINKTDFSI